MKNVYIAGENYSNYQGWIEGALLKQVKNIENYFLKTKEKPKK